MPNGETALLRHPHSNRKGATLERAFFVCRTPSSIRTVSLASLAFQRLLFTSTPAPERGTLERTPAPQHLCMSSEHSWCRRRNSMRNEESEGLEFDPLISQCSLAHQRAREHEE